MSVLSFNATTGETLADWLAGMGDIPPDRIVSPGHPGPATEEDVLALRNGPHKRLCELVDGVLVEKAMGNPESLITVLLLRKIDEFVETHNLGIVLGSDGLVRLFPGRIRLPDVAVFLWDRIPGDEPPDEQVYRFAPNLAVEVLSPSNTLKEMERKREDYFGANVACVWEVSPPEQCVRVYSGVNDVVSVSIADELTGAPVLPGFRLPLKTLFAKRRRP